MISALFISRPRLAIVIAIVTTLAGLLALTRIPVAQLPDIVPPQVAGTASYPGASAAVIEAAVAQPLEAQVVGVDKMIYMKSDQRQRRRLHSHRQFRGRHRPRHRHGQRQQSRANRAIASLPQEGAAARAHGIKSDRRRNPAVVSISTARAASSTPVFITSYAHLNVIDELSRMPGVGQAFLFGRLDYSMRIWFDTSRLTSLGLAPSDVIAAMQAQNVQAPVGASAPSRFRTISSSS